MTSPLQSQINYQNTMKKITLLSSIIFLLMLYPKLNFSQIPEFGVASSFAVFSSAGAFTNVGTTNVTGNVGNNAGAFTAFPPGTLNGQIHNIDATSQKAANDLDSANTFLSGISCGKTIAPGLGNGQIITPGKYCQSAATTLTGNLTLDAEGDANAIFIIKINNTFSAAALSNLILTNSASICNVYWHVTGAFVLGANSTFKGTIVSNGAVTLGDGAVLTGRAFTTAGAISLTNNIITIAAPPEASIISASGLTTFCLGDSVVLSGNVNGIWNTSDSTPAITVNASNDYFVTNSNTFCSVESNHINVIVNPLPTATTGNNIAICNGNNVTLGKTAVAGNTYAWTPATGLSFSTIFNPLANPSKTTTYTLTETITATGCINTDSITVTVDNMLSAAIISAGGATTFCGNEFVILSGNNGAIWSNTAFISTPSLSVNTSGDYFVTDTNACNTVMSNHIKVTVNPQPAAVTGNDVSYCIGNFAALGAPTVSGHTYSWTPAIGLNSTTIARPYARPLISTIYTLTETNTATGCLNTKSVIVTVNPLPAATTIMNTSICSGQSLDIGGNSTTGNTYLWTPMIDLNSNTIANPLASPTDTIIYTLIETISATGCSKSNSVTITINTFPNIITQPTNQDVPVGQTALFSAEVTGTGHTYQWRKGLTNLVNGGNIIGANTDSLTIIAVSSVDTSSSYNVVISGICLNDTVSQNAILSLALPSGIVSSDITNTSKTASIFPNPFTSSINVVVNDIHQTNLAIYFYNAIGVMVLSKILMPHLNTIETYNLPQGFYFYQISSKGKILQSGKLVHN